MVLCCFSLNDFVSDLLDFVLTSLPFFLPMLVSMLAGPVTSEAGFPSGVTHWRLTWVFPSFNKNRLKQGHKIANLISKLNFYKLIPYAMDNC